MGYYFRCGQRGIRQRMKVEDIMAKEVATLQIDDELSLAEDIMRLGRIRHLPVTEGDKIVGIISERDLFRASLASVIDYDYQIKRDYMKTVVIKEVMKTDLITVEPRTSIKEAAQLMLDQKIGCLPVVKGKKLVGLVTETDILRFYVEADKDGEA
jgi:CBS domain-containing protein